MANWVREILEANPDLAALPVAKRARRSLHLRCPDGKILGLFPTGPCHYQDELGQWQALDTMPLYDVGGSIWYCPGLNVVITGEGVVRLGDYSQWTKRIGLFRPSTMELLATRDVPLGNREGDALVAERDEWRVERKITATGYRETLTLKVRPVIPQAQVGDFLVLETLVGGVSMPNGWVEGEYAISEHWSPMPVAWDANGKPLICRRYWRDGTLYTGIPVEELAHAAYPVVVDPDFASEAADGVIRGSNADYATARSTSSLVWTTGNRLELGQSTGFTLYRSYLKFDTSSLPDDATITQVNLRLVCTVDYSDTDFDIQIVKQDWSAQDPLTDAGREAAYDNCLAGTADDGIWRNTSGISINTQYASENLSPAWINKTGNTYYSLRSSRDYGNITPTGNEYAYLSAVEDYTSANRPLLMVRYEGEVTPLLREAGVFTAGTGAITPPYPTGANAPAANDIAILVCESENQAISLSSAQGFVEIGDQANKAAGTAATDPASRLAVYWKRCVGEDVAPTVADSGDHTTGQIYLFAGCKTEGNPWNVFAEGNDGGDNDKTGVIPGATTTVDNCLIFLICTSSWNFDSTYEFSAWTNANLANVQERGDYTATSGLGGGHGSATGWKIAAGAYGNTTVTLLNTSYKGAMSIALEPAPAGGVNVTVDAVLATATAASLIPTVTGGATISGILATATAAGLVPVVSGGTGATVSGELAEATAAGLVPVVSGGTGTTVSAVLAEAIAAALLPIITGGALVTGVLAEAAAAGLVPTVTGGTGATVSGELATAIAAGLVPVVTGGTGATVTTVLAEAIAAALLPTITGGATVNGVLAEAVAAALVATVTGGTGATVSAVLAEAAAAGLIPTVTGGALVSGQLATATAAGLVPVVTGGTGATVSAVLAEAIAAALVPTVTGGATVSTEIATAIAEALIPVVTGTIVGGATVYAVVAEAIATALTPIVTGGLGVTVSAALATALAEALVPRILTLFIQLTLESRSAALTLESRSFALTLEPRSFALTLPTRE